MTTLPLSPLSPLFFPLASLPINNLWENQDFYQFCAASSVAGGRGKESAFTLNCISHDRDRAERDFMPGGSGMGLAEIVHGLQ